MGNGIDARGARGEEVARRGGRAHRREVGPPGASALGRRVLDVAPGLNHARLDPLGELDRLLQRHRAILGPQPGCRDERQNQQGYVNASHAFRSLREQGHARDDLGAALRGIREDTPEGIGGQDSRAPGFVALSGPQHLQPRPRPRWPTPLAGSTVVQRLGGTGCIQPLTSPAGEPSDGGLPAVQ